MNRFARILIVAASVFLALVLAVSVVSAAPNPFNGAWESIDLDGSYQTLTIGGGAGSTHRVRFYDFGASVCDDPPFTGAQEFAASAQGWVTESGNELTGTLPIYCETHPRTFWGDYGFQFVYDPVSDTLFDNTGVLWTRQ